MPSERRPYKDLPDNDLKRAFLLYLFMVDGSATKNLFPLLEGIEDGSPLSKLIAEKLLESTAIKVFYVGKGIEEAKQNVQPLLRKHIGIILDYVAKESGDQSPEHYEHAAAEYQKTVQGCTELKKIFGEEDVSMAVKISTLAPSGTLERLSKSLTLAGSGALMGKDAEDLAAIEKRVLPILEEAQRHHIRLYVDAEQSWINPVIYRVCRDAIARGVDLNVTVQANLQKAEPLVDELLTWPRLPGIKLVRGAYNKIAREKPAIWGGSAPEGKALTDACYNRLLERLYDSPIDFLLAATHNEESLQLAASLQGRAPDGKHHPDMRCATLKGMGESIDKGGMAETVYTPYTGHPDPWWNMAPDRPFPVFDSIAFTMRRGQELASGERGKHALQELYDECKRRKIFDGPIMGAAVRHAMRKPEEKSR